MRRLLKLAFLAGVGYLFYDFFQAIRSSGGIRRPQPQGGPMRQRFMSQSNPQNITGPGKGRRVDIAAGDEDAYQSEIVGRGVVRR